MAAIIRHSVRRYTSAATEAAIRNLGPSATAGGHEGGFKIWKNLTLFVAFPAIVLCGINCYLSHQHVQPEFVKYEHLRLRTKRFPWGDGNHSLFHNAHANPLPDGYEESHH